MNVEKIIKEMQIEDKRTTLREIELKDYFKDRKVIRILAITKSGISGDLILTSRSILDEVISKYKSMGRIVTLPHNNEINRDCYGLCSIRCMKFKDNCRKCIKDFYGVE